jgi:hypothetical protein
MDDRRYPATTKGAARIVGGVGTTREDLDRYIEFEGYRDGNVVEAWARGGQLAGGRERWHHVVVDADLGAAVVQPPGDFRSEDEARAAVQKHYRLSHP